MVHKILPKLGCKQVIKSPQREIKFFLYIKLIKFPYKMFTFITHKSLVAVVIA